MTVPNGSTPQPPPKLPDYEHLTLDLADAVLTVTLDRPEVLNAINGRMHHELTELMEWLGSAGGIRAVVLTGHGRGFSAGGDARWFESATPAEVEALFDEGAPLIRNLLAARMPIVAAVNGPAVGLGATIALCCDVVFAAESAVFADPHVRMGVVAGDGGAMIWPALVGMSRAKEYLLTGDKVPAVEAERIGLVNHVVPDAEVVERAHAFAVRLAEGPALAISGTKEALNALVLRSADIVLEKGLELERATMRSNDHREAVTAFAAGRPPEFTGT
ncbi:enoyl-CoA hydratase/isomerase family protein [Spiractinospora alimapuensis]|uniref:enoyl-CoA hydratase/isomerase family protein n=1 Tax=Spiractinospora alimapuensis TaxID=2820884 RepID=UPI001F45548E|nr:enoyl-CoA hydratase-related protein [Spiractinospora alimapuensis]QVQ51528.1 enoyl-CoA hydratase/isomerase family protein [Spiractinospora alimapuensis]